MNFFSNKNKTYSFATRATTKNYRIKINPFFEIIKLNKGKYCVLINNDLKIINLKNI